MLNEHIFIKSIKEEIIDNLPGEQSHIEMAPYKRPLSSYGRKKATNPIHSAVAIHLFQSIDKKDWNILLIERTLNMTSHKGQIAFPGGKVDKRDKNYIYTAKRESFEELGIEINKGICIGKLSPVYIPISNFDVHPYIFYHDNIPKIYPNKTEVNHYFSISITDILNPSSTRKFNYKNEKGIIIKDVPCFNIKEKIIWGATALIISELKQIVANINNKNQKEEQH